MNVTKALGFVPIIGTMLGAVGCFLPWAQELTAPDVFSYPQPSIIGIDFMLGKFALLASIATFFCQLLFLVRNKKYAVLIALISGIVGLSCSGAWILRPGIYETHIGSLRVLYGTYITFAGEIVVSTATILLLAMFATETAAFSPRAKTNG